MFAQVDGVFYYLVMVQTNLATSLYFDVYFRSLYIGI